MAKTLIIRRIVATRHIDIIDTGRKLFAHKTASHDISNINYTYMYLVGRYLVNSIPGSCNFNRLENKMSFVFYSKSRHNRFMFSC